MCVARRDDPRHAGKKQACPGEIILAVTSVRALFAKKISEKANKGYFLLGSSAGFT